MRATATAVTPAMATVVMVATDTVALVMAMTSTSATALDTALTVAMRDTRAMVITPAIRLPALASVTNTAA